MVKLIEYFIIFFFLVTALFYFRLRWLIFVPLILCFFDRAIDPKAIRLADGELFVLVNAIMKVAFVFIAFRLLIVWIVTLVHHVNGLILNLLLSPVAALIITVTRVVQTTSSGRKTNDIVWSCLLVRKMNRGRLFFLFFFCQLPLSFFFLSWIHTL